MFKRTVIYKGGYKYQLHESYQAEIQITPAEETDCNYISLDRNGHLTIKEGYAWDGPSGPTIDTKNFMRGSLVHDALYQLMRMGLLSTAEHRMSADDELKRICLEDGMSAIHAWWVYESVRKFGAGAANSKNTNPILVAPGIADEQITSDTNLLDQYTQ